MLKSTLVVNLLIAAFLIILDANALSSQDVHLSTPENTVSTLFKAMYEGDSTLARLTFAEDATLNSVFTTKDGIQKVNSGDVSGFIDAIGTPHDDVWDERVANFKVNIDGDLAQAWMDYSFYLGEKFSHCGVNAIHLIRIEDEWKIFQIVDTRRKVDCN